MYSVNDLAKRFFRYRGRIPENHFIENKVPFDIQKLRVFFKENNYKDVIFMNQGSIIEKIFMHCWEVCAQNSEIY